MKANNVTITVDSYGCTNIYINGEELNGLKEITFKASRGRPPTLSLDMDIIGEKQ